MGPIGSIIRIALRYGVGGIIGYEGDSQLAILMWWPSPPWP